MKNNYIDNNKFLEEIRVYRKKCDQYALEGKEKPKLTNYLGKCLYDIANNLSMSSNFINYSFRQEMVSDAIETMLKYFDSYDVSRDNPFAYFTTIAWQAFVGRIDIEERNRYLVYKNFERSMIYDTDLYDESENHLLGPKIYANIEEFISNYERKQEEKRIKRLEKRKQREREENEKASGITSSYSVDGKHDVEPEGQLSRP